MKCLQTQDKFTVMVGAALFAWGLGGSYYHPSRVAGIAIVAGIALMGIGILHWRNPEDRELEKLVKRIREEENDR